METNKRQRTERDRRAEAPTDLPAVDAPLALRVAGLAAATDRLPDVLWKAVFGRLQGADVGRFAGVGRGAGAFARAAFADVSHLVVRRVEELVGGGARHVALLLPPMAVEAWQAPRARGGPAVLNACRRLRSLRVRCLALGPEGEAALALLMRRSAATLTALQVAAPLSDWPLHSVGLAACTRLAFYRTPQTGGMERLAGLRALWCESAGAFAQPLHACGARLCAIGGFTASLETLPHLALHPLATLVCVLTAPLPAFDALLQKLHATLEVLELSQGAAPAPYTGPALLDLPARVRRLVAHDHTIAFVRRAPGLQVLSAALLHPHSMAALVPGDPPSRSSRGVGGGGASGGGASGGLDGLRNLRVLHIVTDYSGGHVPPAFVPSLVDLGPYTPQLRAFSAQVPVNRYAQQLARLAAARIWPSLGSLHLFSLADGPRTAASARAVGRAFLEADDDLAIERAVEFTNDHPVPALRGKVDLALALAAWPCLQCLHLSQRACTSTCAASANTISAYDADGADGGGLWTRPPSRPPATTGITRASLAVPTPPPPLHARPPGAYLHCLSLAVPFACAPALLLPALRHLTLRGTHPATVVSDLLQATRALMTLRLFVPPPPAYAPVPPVEQGDAFSRPLRLHALHTVVLDVRHLHGCEALLQQVAAHAPVVCARRVSNAALLAILRSVGDPFPRLEALTLAGDVSTSTAVVLAGLVPRLASLLPPLPCARPITATQE